MEKSKIKLNHFEKVKIIFPNIMNVKNKNQKESLIERLERIINDVDIKRFQDVSKTLGTILKQDVPSQSETKRILDELYDHRGREKTGLRLEYDISKMVSDYKWYVEGLKNFARIKLKLLLVVNK